MAEDTTFDWSKPVAKWDNEQLDAWARNNITNNTLPELGWHEKQVKVWAREVCLFDEAEAEVLIKQRITGRVLTTYKDPLQIKAGLGLLEGPARELWFWINKMRKAHNMNETREFQRKLEKMIKDLIRQLKKNSTPPFSLAPPSR